MPRSPSVCLPPALLALVVSITGAFAISPASAAPVSNEQSVAELAQGCWAIRGADDDGVARRLNWREAKPSPSGLFGEIRRVVPDPRERSLQLALTNHGSQLIMAVLPDGADDDEVTIAWPAKIPLRPVDPRTWRPIDRLQLSFTARAWRIVFEHGDMPTRFSDSPAIPGTLTAYYQQRRGPIILRLEVSASRLRMQAILLAERLPDPSIGPQLELLFEGRRESCDAATATPPASGPRDSKPRR
ncbi:MULTISPECIES: hypothetical protein [Lysobacter]|uniref:Uncharacterized protein n=1 Tax=Lysobacter gummosus TaxID=262324 RepID=A0ABY3XIU7_9GAMM|nr:MULTISPECIES: hypothetical protein [Lysobacter]ALN91127.1 hypothetical protein LG3211_2158 [Lysobacter gummosus]UJB17176.1 hypothetical protein L1A79_12320 [Lysobacter capsici]UJQ29101.1 hypothetical protein L2D09_02545 [Lysobacter gummosus]UNP31549.1 hypothetical protein MOV92_10000 [Lysobacter gummosus]